MFAEVSILDLCEVSAYLSSYWLINLYHLTGFYMEVTLAWYGLIPKP